MTKQKEGEESKAEEFNGSKGWFDNFIKRFGLKNVRITGEAASADQEAAAKFPDAVKKIIKEKGYLPERVFNANESALFCENKPPRTFISKRNEHQDLRRKEWASAALCKRRRVSSRPALTCNAARPPALTGRTTRRPGRDPFFLDWFHQIFVPEIRKYLARKGLPLKLLLMLDNNSGHPAPSST